MGSAPASGSDSRALAENVRGDVLTKVIGIRVLAKLLDAWRVQRRPRAGVLPNFGFRD